MKDNVRANNLPSSMPYLAAIISAAPIDLNGLRNLCELHDRRGNGALAAILPTTSPVI